MHDILAIDFWKDEPDLDDMIMDGMAMTIGRLMALSGVDSNVTIVDCDGEKLTFSIERRDVSVDPVVRLDEILGVAKDFESMRPDLSLTKLTMGILQADGWTVTVHALRTPLWMEQGVEFDRLELAKKEGMEWLATCTSL